MRIRRALVPPVAVVAVAILVLAGVDAALAQRRGGAAPPAPPGSAAQPGPQAHATLNQLMRAILFPNSNVIFAVQNDDPTKLKGPREASAATDPLTGLYGGWEAVENSSLAIAEAANLLTVPGRRCSNGRPVPVQNADWLRFVQGLREAGAASLKAAQSKNQDTIIEVTDQVATACSNCHEVYRDKTAQQGGAANRCIP